MYIYTKIYLYMDNNMIQLHYYMTNGEGCFVSVGLRSSLCAFHIHHLREAMLLLHSIITVHICKSYNQGNFLSEGTAREWNMVVGDKLCYSWAGWQLACLESWWLLILMKQWGTTTP